MALDPSQPRCLILLAKAPNASIPDEVARGDLPRVEYLELAKSIGAEILDFHSVRASKHPLVAAAARKGASYALAILGLLRRREFDHIYATGEDIGLPLAAFSHVLGWYGRATVVVHQCDTRKRRFALRALGASVWRNVICLSSEQRRILTDEIGLPGHKVHHFDQWVDAAFYDPALAVKPVGLGEFALSCGRESRDYGTLQKAAEGVPHAFQVVASGWAPHAGFDRATGIEARSNLRVTSGVSYRELRDLYARARMVVAPLLSVNYAAGVTSICEGMAMGKAIIASDSPGIRDYVKPGVSGFIVPVGDSNALREAIRDLWNDPERCAAMGRHNRQWVLDRFATDQYVRRVAGLFGIARASGELVPA